MSGGRRNFKEYWTVLEILSRTGYNYRITEFFFHAYIKSRVCIHKRERRIRKRDNKTSFTEGRFLWFTNFDFCLDRAGCMLGLSASSVVASAAAAASSIVRSTSTAAPSVIPASGSSSSIVRSAPGAVSAAPVSRSA